MQDHPARRCRCKRAAALVVFVLTIAGCGSSSSSSASSSVARTTATAKAASKAASVTASNGVALPKVATRIVSLTDASTEDLFAVGAGRQVVAVDSYSIYPPSAPRTSLSAFDPNVEALADYHPDLVVTSQNVDHIATQLAALHIPMLYEGAPTNLSGAYAQILALGTVSGHGPAAAALVTRMRAEVASIVASVKKERPPLTVYHELTQDDYSASSKTFIGQIYSLLGLRNIADAAAKTAVYPQLSDEYIIGANPDLIVLADTVCCGQTATKVEARPGWRNIRAVRDGDILAVNDTVASEWGPRIVDFLAEVAAEVRKIEAQG
ncbi:MAG: ABC transporter substrate-binding protein [Solirubrobacteraceae bacterium]